MLIIPVSRSPDWRRPPVVTLLLILLNCLIYFGLQSSDDRREVKALNYYFNSKLPGIELPRYIRYLSDSVRNRDAEKARRAMAEDHGEKVLMAMEADKAFMERLRQHRVIHPSEPEFEEWRRLRAEFERLANASVVARFGFKPADPTIAGFIGHMFLHGSFDHLLGNMALLFIVGYMVEEALGKRRYLAFYLLAGMGGGLFDLVINADRLVPGIGASGAVSGVMAMFVAIYGLQRIRFFYWILIYFDFFKAPAIAMLPLWMANELYQFFFNAGSHVNYMAHLGGFAAGAGLIAAQRHWGRNPLEAPEQEAPVDPVPGELAKVDGLLTGLKLDEARLALRRLAETHHFDTRVLERYYQLTRTMPSTEDYHRAAGMIFGLPESDPATAGLVHKTFLDYLEQAKPTVRFSVGQLIVLVRRLARSGYPEDAERLFHVLARRSPQHQDLPGLLMVLADGFRRSGDEAQRLETLMRLQREFPGTEAAQAAAQLFR